MSRDAKEPNPQQATNSSLPLALAAALVLLTSLSPLLLAAQSAADQNSAVSAQSAALNRELELRAQLRSHPSDIALTRDLADLLERSDRPRAAVVLRRSAVANARTSQDIAQARLELAIALVQAGDNKEAISLLQSVLVREPANETAQFEIGTAFARSEDFAAAFSAFAKATQLRPSDAEAQLSAAKALVTLNRYAEAEPFLEAAARARGETTEVHALRGLIYTHTAREQQAIGELQQAVRLDPANADTQLHLGEALRQAGHLAEAVDPLKRAAALKPTVSAFFQLSRTYRALGQTGEARQADEAIKALEEERTRSTKIDVLKAEAERNVAATSYPKAAELYRTALDMRPRDPDLLFRLAAVRGQMHQANQEQLLLQQALAQDPHHVGALTALGTLQAAAGDRAAARQHLAEAVRLDPQNPDALSNLAVLLARDGDLTSAESMLSTAIDIDPANAAATRNLGLIYAAQNRLAEAEAALRHSLTLAPRDVTTYLSIAQLFVSQQRFTEAITALNHAKELAPHNPDPPLRLAQALFASGEAQSALAEARQALAIAPNLPAALHLQQEICSSTKLDRDSSCAKTPAAAPPFGQSGTAPPR